MINENFEKQQEKPGTDREKERNPGQERDPNKEPGHQTKY